MKNLKIWEKKTMEEISNKDIAREYIKSIKMILDPCGEPYRLLTTKEVTDLLGISYESFTQSILIDPSFPRIRVGKTLRYPRQSVIDWVGHKSEEWYK